MKLKPIKIDVPILFTSSKDILIRRETETIRSIGVPYTVRLKLDPKQNGIRITLDTIKELDHLPRSLWKISDVAKAIVPKSLLFGAGPEFLIKAVQKNYRAEEQVELAIRMARSNEFPFRHWADNLIAPHYAQLPDETKRRFWNQVLKKFHPNGIQDVIHKLILTDPEIECRFLDLVFAWTIVQKKNRLIFFTETIPYFERRKEPITNAIKLIVWGVGNTKYPSMKPLLNTTPETQNLLMNAIDAYSQVKSPFNRNAELKQTPRHAFHYSDLSMMMNDNLYTYLACSVELILALLDNNQIGVNDSNKDDIYFCGAKDLVNERSDPNKPIYQLARTNPTRSVLFVWEPHNLNQKLLQTAEHQIKLEDCTALLLKENFDEISNRTGIAKETLQSIGLELEEV